jgi:phosphotransferase system enzyme I (PtsI)
MEYIRLRGLGVSPGIAIGEVQLTKKVVFTTRKENIPADKVKSELDRLNGAIERTHEQLVKIRDNIKDIVGEEHAFIFESHLLILQDKSLLLSLKDIIREERSRAEWAISRVHLKYQELFESIDDEYFKQRKFDVADVLSKIYRNLEPAELGKRDDGKERILVARELLPSEAAIRLSKGNVLAVALDMGGQTSHTAILARSLNIPAVMGLRNISQRVRNGDILIVDGTDGEVLINPPAAIKKEFVSKKEKYDDYRKELIKIAKLSSKTLDKFTFLPMANIELP